MCRLAVLFRKPLHEVARWPAWEVGLIENYLAVQPGPDERLEFAIAQLTAIHVNLNTDPKSPRRTIGDFLPFKSWEEKEQQEKIADERYSDVDREMLAALMKG